MLRTSLLFIKTKQVGILLGALALISLSNCTNNKDNETEIIEAEIVSISVQESAITGDDIKVTVDFQGLNGCSEAYNITANKVGQNITLSAYYSVPTDARACTETLPVHRLKYTYFADMGGIYFFTSSKNSSVSDTLQVF